MRSLYALLALIGVVLASPTEDKLLKTLFAEYSSETRPVLKTADVVTANLGFTLTAIDSIDIEDGDFNVQGWLKFQWTDMHLRWDASQYKDISVLRLNSEKIWKPDIKVYNGPDSTMDNTMALLYPNGNVIWVPPIRVTAKCVFKSFWFPFDVQKCTLVFGSWTFDAFKVNLTTPNVTEAEFIENKEWKLLSVNHRRVDKYYPCCKEPYTSIEAEIIVKRRACKYLCCVFIPLMILACLGLSTMMVPATRADLRLIVVSLLLGTMVVLMYLLDNPQLLTLMAVSNGNFFVVLASLFVCNCVHLSILRSDSESSLLAKLSGYVLTSEEKTAGLIVNSASRYHRTLDIVFVIPLTLLTAGTALLFFFVSFI